MMKRHEEKKDRTSTVIRWFLMLILLVAFGPFFLGYEYHPLGPGGQLNAKEDPDVLIETVNLFGNTTLPGLGTLTSGVIPTRNDRGYYALQYWIDDGAAEAVTVKYSASVDGTNFLTPTGASDIATAVTSASGPGGDGRDIVSFAPPVCKYFKIVVTETGNSTCGFTADLASQ